MRSCLRTLFLLIVMGPAFAGSGAGELLLDRGATAALLAAGTPRELRVEVPGFGDLVVELQPPRHVLFLEGGIEGNWEVRLPALDYRSPVRVRLVPGVEPLQGVVRLEVAWARPESLPPGALDLGPLIPPVDLPRGLEGTIPGLEEPAPSVHLDVQGLQILAERLEIRFAMTVGR